MSGWALIAKMTTLSGEPVQSAQHIRFGTFDLNTRTGELRRAGQLVKLSPKPAQLLVLLAQSAGDLLTRQAIRDRLWDSDTHLDFEHAVNFCIREIRGALGDNAQKPLYIETLPRRGYRFIPNTLPGSTAPGDGQNAPLEAYSSYARGRKAFGQASKDALELACKEFEQALVHDPDYALAHSALGATLGLRSLNRRDPIDLHTAQHHLERAIELDPELGEPYPWLAFILMRKNEIRRAIEAGVRGVQLQPSLAHAHYFLGLARFVGSEADIANLQPAVNQLLIATRTDPFWQPSWFVLSYAALVAGDYKQAELFAYRLLRINAEGKGLPFIGAEIVLGAVALRRCQPAEAHVHLNRFLDRMAHSDHMYRDAMVAVAACILGDVDLRYGTPAAALTSFRRGWHLVQEYPRVMAFQRIAARAQSGLAAAYAAQGDREHAAVLLTKAVELARASELAEHSAAAATLCELYWSIAVAALRVGESHQALDLLKRAADFGWCDAAWLETDAEFITIRECESFRDIVGLVRRRPKIAFL